MYYFKNKYRIETTRLQTWDYRWPGVYFITICTHQRSHYFGEVLNGRMQLSPIGIIADLLWYQIPYHSKNVELGAFVVMPNHIHGILIIKDITTGSDVDDGMNNREHIVFGDENILSVAKGDRNNSIGQKRFQNIGKNSISSMIGSYKAAVSKHARRLGFEFNWQVRFHDKIIYDRLIYKKVTRYIINNPRKWRSDKLG